MASEQKGNPSLRGDRYLERLAKNRSDMRAQSLNETLKTRESKRASLKERVHSPQKTKSRKQEQEIACAIRDLNHRDLELEFDR